MISSDHTAGLDESARITTLPVARTAISPRLLRLVDAARYLSMGAKALRGLIGRGELRYVQVSKNAPFLIDLRDLDEFIERHKLNG
jgi:hypothetical protein